MRQLFELLQQPARLPEGLHDYLLDHVHTQTVKKWETIVQIGKVCDRMYFIQQGLFRGFKIIKGRQKTIWFMKENDLMTAVHSFYTRTVSKEGIVALENGILHSLSYERLEEVYKRYTEFNLNGRKLTEHYRVRECLDTDGLRLETAKERYDYYEKLYPEIFTRVPGRYLASFLGLSGETFSRIRADRNRRKKD